MTHTIIFAVKKHLNSIRIVEHSRLENALKFPYIKLGVVVVCGGGGGGA